MSVIFNKTPFIQSNWTFPSDNTSSCETDSREVPTEEISSQESPKKLCSFLQLKEDARRRAELEKVLFGTVSSPKERISPRNEKPPQVPHACHPSNHGAHGSGKRGK